jgi:hypothetical protein
MVSLSFFAIPSCYFLDLNYTDKFFCYTKKYFIEPMHKCSQVCYQIATDLQIVHVVFTIPLLCKLDFRMWCMLYTVDIVIVVVCILLWEYLLLFVSEFFIFLSPP